MSTGRASNIGFVAWISESSFADPSSDTYTIRHQIRDDQIDVSRLVRPLIPRMGAYQRFNEGDFEIVGPFGDCSFTVSLDATGHGAATDGALTETNLAKLLAHVFGSSVWTQIGGALTAGTNDANTLTSTNTTLLAGGLARVGEHGDGRAEGQATVLQDATSSYELDVDLPAAPDAGDDVHAMGLVYPISAVSSGRLTSSGATSNNTLRFVIATANQQYVVRGCACTAVELTGLGPGEVPMWRLTFTGVAWNPVSQTFPSATATADYAPAPCTVGSLFVQARGTTTRAVVVPRDLTISIGQGMAPIVGQGGGTIGQTIQGWARVPAKTTVSFAIEAEAATAAPVWHDYFSVDPNSQVARHLLYTASVVDGSALALYLPNAKPIGQPPTQTPIDGINFQRVAFEAMTNLDTTNELTLSNWRLGCG